MDPIAHTLVGAALAQTGLREKTRYATAALLIGANLPDIDGASMLLGTESLCWRRGWTHGVLAMAVLPAMLTGALLLLDRLRNPRRRPADAGALLTLSYLALLTHPFLDWLNNYGVRLLMPFDGQWFYGDSLFIVDPWMWLILGGSAFLFYSKRWSSLFGWTIGTVVAGTLIWQAGPPGMVPAKVAWTGVVVLLVLLRMRRSFYHERSAGGLARFALAVTAVYIGLMLASTWYARSWMRETLASRGVVTERLMVGPLPMTPFTRDVVAETADGYRYGTLSFSPAPHLDLAERRIPKPDGRAIVRQAMEAPKSHCFMNWARFPFVEVAEEAVYLIDARYTRERGVGFGSLAVRGR